MKQGRSAGEIVLDYVRIWFGFASDWITFGATKPILVY